MREFNFAKSTQNSLAIGIGYTLMANEEIADDVFKELKPQYEEWYLVNSHAHQPNKTGCPQKR
ncbi:hypothetical protein [Bacillus sp. XF8]|uniref:hypothetical protein n=1 Tax=Bacillus sp. XF8 TaxID=2819289 RepID=UPI001AA09351|nr:hypothetical protein [Bacillus sp. XF8]MBO1583300.1 hypothetical protein [Bacillus sp. XF8]